MKNIKMLVIAVLLVAVAVTSYAVSGTYAKYTSTFTGSDAARVAEWAFELNDVTATNTFEFDLFETINDTDGSTETDVADGKIIAPGTTGSFAIKVANLSEVNATYAIDYTVTNDDGIAIEFSANGTDGWSDELADVTATAINMGANATKKVYWRWVYERGTTADDKTTNNTADTTLGLDGTAEVSVQAKVIVNQVD